MYDTFVQLSSRSKREMQGRLQVTFEGEDGVDAGGLTKEMYSILAREIFNPNYGLFIKSHDSPTFQPNPHSSVNNLHLQYFNFVGRIIGKAIYDGNQFDAYVRCLFDTVKITSTAILEYLTKHFGTQHRYFTRSFYKHMLGLNVVFEDMQSIDPQYFEVFNNSRK